MFFPCAKCTKVIRRQAFRVLGNHYHRNCLPTLHDSLTCKDEVYVAQVRIEKVIPPGEKGIAPDAQPASINPLKQFEIVNGI